MDEGFKDMLFQLGAERDRYKEALKELYQFVLKDETLLVKSLRLIGEEVHARRWMANIDNGTNGMDFDTFREVEVMGLLDSIEALASKSIADSYPKYDDAMTKANAALDGKVGSDG